ncbi:CDP-glycerol glycerophosphotransferase family protein, partial [Campylobacter jejuni]|nr:capsular biosynthesis protein [Campylobacter jejuni]ECY2131728.1 capsular biosynthesis protein [Campylobacter jejuni]
LQELHEKYNYKIVFNPHPQIRPYLEDFNLPNYIIIPSVEMSMQKLFCESSLMITDYSSVAFEMIILKKPVIYYQFDQDYFFYKHFLKRGYYNYKKMEFSYLVNNQKDLIFYIEFLLAHKI